MPIINYYTYKDIKQFIKHILKCIFQSIITKDELSHVILKISNAVLNHNIHIL
jgi:hypothetical protein